MNIIEGIAILIGTIIIFVFIGVFNFTKSDVVTAWADKERALIAGEVRAQDIENEAAQNKADWWQEIRTAVKPVAIFSFRAVAIVAAIVVIGLAVTTAFGGGRWWINKSASPIVTTVENGLTIVTHGGQTFVLDSYTGQRGQLAESAGASPERAITARAVEIAKATSNQPVVLSALQSANGGEQDG